MKQQPEQVITISPIGTIRGLRGKPGQFNIAEIGHAMIERVTLIEWDADCQMWTVEWTEAGARQFNQLCGIWSVPSLRPLSNLGLSISALEAKEIDQRLLWETYEAANRAEVMVIQAMQKE